MIADLVLAFVISWFLFLSTICLTLLYRAIITSNPYKAAPVAVALTYLGFIALTAQDCFFPGRTPRMFKIVSMGPDKADSVGQREGDGSVGVTTAREEKVERRVEDKESGYILG
jgi:hypothetical protein